MVKHKKCTLAGASLGLTSSQYELLTVHQGRVLEYDADAMETKMKYLQNALRQFKHMSQGSNVESHTDCSTLYDMVKHKKGIPAGTSPGLTRSQHVIHTVHRGRSSRSDSDTIDRPVTIE